MSLETLNKKIVETKKKYAEALGRKAVLESNKSVVLSSVKNDLEESIVKKGDKAPSDTKLERLAKDTKEYQQAVGDYGKAIKAATELEAEVEMLEREYEIEKMKASV